MIVFPHCGLLDYLDESVYRFDHHQIYCLQGKKDDSDLKMKEQVLNEIIT